MRFDTAALRAVLCNTPTVSRQWTRNGQATDAYFDPQ
jgi:hypothetical protein